MEARSTQQVKYSAMEINDNVNKTMAEFTSLNKSCVEGPALSNAQMHSIKGRVRHCLVSGLPLPSWAVAYNDIKNGTYTSDGSWAINGLRHVPGRPNYREIIWANTVEHVRNLNINEMDDESYIALYPSNEDPEVLRNEFRGLQNQSNE